ncbi:MAG TPA: hypothetical protein VMZ53_25835 [Kofleriaceae bacterium]|nr:hypothetical protein [Kofleriaceae bacterium]
MLTAKQLEDALSALGEVLADRGKRFEVAIIGGGALAIANLIARPTKDLDVVAMINDGRLETAAPLPADLVEAIADVAAYLGLASDWLNNGPTAMLRFGLPEGFLARCDRRAYGGLVVRFADRLDHIHFKLYAAADDRPGGKHHRDLVALAPTRDELRAAARWAREHDPSREFSQLVDQVLASFEEDGA